jgi:hypothetical protein
VRTTTTMSTKISAITVTQVKILGSLEAHREDEGTRACNSQKDLDTNCRDPLWKDANEENDRDGEGWEWGHPNRRSMHAHKRWSSSLAESDGCQGP